MKTSYILIATIVLFAFLFSAFAQTTPKPALKTETFLVKGNCDLCKTRIEKALKVKGVTSTSWNIETKMATVSFDPEIVSLDNLHKKVAAVGHDTEKAKANDKVYARLHSCCKYR